MNDLNDERALTLSDLTEHILQLVHLLQRTHVQELQLAQQQMDSHSRTLQHVTRQA